MRKISIHRISDKKGAKGYTPLSNSIIQSEHLSLEEAGLMAFLLSLPIDFKIVQKNILKKLGQRISAGGFRKAWKKLVEKGYIVKQIYYADNLKRVGWIVFENPEDREFQNRELREPTSLKSKQEKIKEVENTIVDNNTSTYTGTSILEEKMIDPLIPHYKEALQEATDALISSTSLGERILDYTNPALHSELKEVIGSEAFSSIEKDLSKYTFAYNKLNKK